MTPEQLEECEETYMKLTDEDCTIMFPSITFELAWQNRTAYYETKLTKQQALLERMAAALEVGASAVRCMTNEDHYAWLQDEKQIDEALAEYQQALKEEV